MLSLITGTSCQYGVCFNINFLDQFGLLVN